VTAAFDGGRLGRLKGARASIAARLANIQQGYRADLEPSANLQKVFYCAPPQVSQESDATAVSCKNEGISQSG